MFSIISKATHEPIGQASTLLDAMDFADLHCEPDGIGAYVLSLAGQCKYATNDPEGDYAIPGGERSEHLYLIAERVAQDDILGAPISLKKLERMSENGTEAFVKQLAGHCWYHSRRAKSAYHESLVLQRELRWFVQGFCPIGEKL